MQMKRGVAAWVGGALLFAGAGFGPSGLRTMSTAEIRPGMRGYGLTVFRGTEPERFDVEVIDVLHNFRPDQDLVLVKTPHPLLDHAGSVAGMSGSPVYLEDRLIGAYAYGWAFGKDPIAGVTPIASMLREIDRPRAQPTPLAAPLPAPARAGAPRTAGYDGREHRDPFWALTHRTAQPVRNETWVPAATPLLVGGLPASVAALLRERLAPLGLEVLEATGGASTQKSGPSAYVDGGSLAVTLLRGDVQATAVGTLTYVDGRRAVAFGHPMLEAGELSLPTATSRVLHVLASERSSFKIAEAIAPLGALVQDRQAAVVVDTKERARTIPIDVHLRGLPGLPRDHWRIEAADHRLLTPALVMTALASALGATVNDTTDMMFRAESVVSLKKHGAQRVIDEGFTPTGVGQPLALSRLRLFDLLEAAYDNPFGPDQVERVEVTFDLRFGHDVTELIGAELAQDELDPGEPARVVVTLRPYAGPLEQRVFEVPLSPALAGEHLELELTPGSQVQLEQPIPRNLGDVLSAIRAGLPSTALAVAIERKGRGVSLSGHVVRDLPGSALDALSTARDTARSASFAMARRITVPLGRVLVGSAKLGVSVRKEKR